MVFDAVSKSAIKFYWEIKISKLSTVPPPPPIRGGGGSR